MSQMRIVAALEKLQRELADAKAPSATNLAVQAIQSAITVVKEEYRKIDAAMRPYSEIVRGTMFLLSRQYMLCCFNCGAMHVVAGAIREEDAIVRARVADGWVWIRDKCYCKECAAATR